MIAAIVRFSIRRFGVVIALAIAVMVYGLYSLTQVSLDVFPEFSPTQVVIQTEAPGLSAELVELMSTSKKEPMLKVRFVSNKSELTVPKLPGIKVPPA